MYRTRDSSHLVGLMMLQALLKDRFIDGKSDLPNR